MSTIMHYQEFDNEPYSKPERFEVSESLELGAKEIEQNGFTRIYLGGTTFVIIDLNDDEPGIIIES